MTAKRGVDFLKSVTEYIAKTNRFDNILQKMRITEHGDGRCLAEVKLDQEHLNLHHGIHGGFITTIIENVSTYALQSKPCNPGNSVDMKVMFLKTAKMGDEIIVDANTVNTDGKLAYIECEVRNKKDGSVVAKAAQTKYINSE